MRTTSPLVHQTKVFTRKAFAKPLQTARWKSFDGLSRAIIALAIIVPGGCSGGTDGPKLVKCSGTITYQGKPLPNAQVLFIPQEAGAVQSARSAQAITTAEGHYRLETLSDGDGVIPGKYQVTITARGPGKPIPSDVNPGLDANEAFLPGPPLIPEKYFRPETSGLTAEIPSGGTSAQDFKLP